MASNATRSPGQTPKRLQRRVQATVALLVVVPMLVTGLLTAAWVTSRMDDTIAHWLRDAARLNLDWLAGLHHNGQLYADLLDELVADRWDDTTALAPRQLTPLAAELGVGFVQLYDLDGRLVASSRPVKMDFTPEPGHHQKVVHVADGGRSQLAALTVEHVPRSGTPRYRLVVGVEFDKPLLQKLGQLSGLKTRLFYPQGGDFAKAFSEDASAPLRLRLPAEAFDRLTARQDWFSPDAEDGQYWGYYSPVADSAGRVEAVLFSGLPRRGGAALLSDQGALSVAIVLLGACVGGLLGWGLSRLVARPVEELRDGVLRVSSQDFQTALPVRGHDELADLARAFNTMAQSLRAARDEQLHQFQRDKIAALGELSLALAHEIRNPLGVMASAAQLLDRADDKPERRRELTAMIQEESARIDALLRDFQQLARHRRPEFAPLDPAAPLDAALRLQLAARPEVKVHGDYHHGRAHIDGDAELLQQAWKNLVKNALEALGDTPAVLRPRTWIEGDQVVVALEDNGPGVPLEQVHKLFEPFHTTKEHGSGLGLTLASTLVEACDGRLEYAPGKLGGALFMMKFKRMAHS